MPDRQRKRRGAHESIGGLPAEEVLEGLVDQFSDPFAFVRELIQNALDAGSSRIEVEMAYANGELEIAVRDDGEGMDREIIEGYLLTLFRSTKDKDLTKIGKFGIGFVSLFALDPREVVVDTGRDTIWHRVVIAEDKSYELLRMPDPYEGTTVTIRVRRSREKASEDCARVHDAAARWCRFAEADIVTTATGVRDAWTERPIRATFTVDAPVVVEEVADGFHAVMGPHPEATPPVGFYNRGLTLWEAEEGIVPGVTFRVHGRHLEHTLTRDNVLRDRHFEQVTRRLQALAKGKLGDAVHHEATAAAAAGDLERVRRLFASLASTVPWEWRWDVPLLPAHGRAPVALSDLRWPGGARLASFFGSRPVHFAPPATPLAIAAAEAGHLVLVAEKSTDAHLLWLAGLLALTPTVVGDAFFRPSPVEPDPAASALLVSMRRLVHELGWKLTFEPGRFARGGRRLEGELAVVQAEPFSLQAADARDTAGIVVVDVEHPVFRKLCVLPADLAAPLALRAVTVSIGSDSPLPVALVEAALRALKPVSA